jgi:hypothetical protein
VVLIRGAERLKAGEGQVRLAQGLVLRRVGVHELRHLGRVRLPVVDELRLADELTDPGADHVHADHRAVLHPDQLHEAGRLEDLALAVATQVVVVGLHLVAVLLLGLRLGQPDGGQLRVGVGDPRDAGLVDHGRVHPGDLLGDEDALLEAAVGELKAGHDVADRVDVRHAGAQPLVGQHVAAVQLDALLLVTEAGRGRAPADRDQEQLGLDGLPPAMVT